VDREHRVELPEILIPTPLRAELHMAGARYWTNDRYLSFRVDPGRAFELHGFIRDVGDDRYHTAFSQRHRPDEQPTWVTAGTGLTADSLPDHLRHAVAHAASLAARRPGWYQARKSAPEWLMAWPLTVPDVAANVKDTTAGRAHDTRRTHFAYLDGERIVCSANPPLTGLFFSVTPRCHWSAHEGQETFPLEYPPDAAMFGITPIRNPAQLAATDRLQIDSPTLSHVVPDIDDVRAHPARTSTRASVGRGR